MEVPGRFPSHRPLLVVSNHLGYLDVAVLARVLPLSFVSRADVRGWPLIGFLARTAGTIFVERESRAAATDFVGSAQGRLEDGASVLVFPEGTSSRGESVLPFRASAFAAAARVPRARILPLHIALLSVGERDADGAEVRDIACWHGEMEFAPHFWNFLGAGGARFRVSAGEAFACDGLDRKEAARIARDEIVALGRRADARQAGSTFAAPGHI